VGTNCEVIRSENEIVQSSICKPADPFLQTPVTIDNQLYSLGTVLIIAFMVHLSVVCVGVAVLTAIFDCKVKALFINKIV